MLYNKTKKSRKLVHRLVAEAFVPNPHNYQYVNHKDENVLNNSFENLEWCTMEYNNNYGTANIRMAITKGRMVDQFLPNGKFIARYACISVASMLTGISYSKIKHHCAEERYVNKQYFWKYVKDPSCLPRDLTPEELDVILKKIS